METIDDHLTEASSLPSEKYLVVYFAKQSDYYLAEYKSHHQGNKFTFNIGSFLGGAFWFLYRRMFPQLLISFCIMFGFGFLKALILQLLEVDERTTKLFETMSNLVFGIALGFIGNYLYIKKADKKISAILRSTENEDERIALLEKAGGVSNAPYYVLAALLFGVIILFIVNN